jgi:hypothetical protein
MGIKREPFRGKVRIGDHSGLRKLMRAARRGKLPAERAGVIKRATESAAKRSDKYVSSVRRGMNALVAAIQRRAS